MRASSLQKLARYFNNKYANSHENLSDDEYDKFMDCVYDLKIIIGRFYEEPNTLSIGLMNAIQSYVNKVNNELVLEGDEGNLNKDIYENEYDEFIECVKELELIISGFYSEPNSLSIGLMDAIQSYVNKVHTKVKFDDDYEYGGISDHEIYNRNSDHPSKYLEGKRLGDGRY